MKTVLVIGGSGFVGSALVPALSAAGYAVSVLNRGRASIPGNDQWRVDQLIADRNDPAQIRAVARTFDAVIDTSGYTQDQVALAYEVFGQAASVWVHLSSSAVYPALGETVVRETDPTGGAAVWGVYGRQKSQADAYLLGQGGVPKVVIRPPYLYGPRNSLDRETFVWARALQGLPVLVPGDGSALLQFLHVQDLAAFVLCVLADLPSADAVYNLADPEMMSALDWAKMLAEMVSDAPQVVAVEDAGRGYHERAYFPFRDLMCAVDVGKASVERGWAPDLGLGAGFREVLSHYTPDQLAALSAQSEVERAIIERLGL